MQAAGGCSSSAGATPCRKPGPPQERGEPAVRFRRAQHGFCWSVLHESGRWHDPGPLFAGGMLVSPDDGTVDQRHRLERSGRQGLENPKPNAHPGPSVGSGRMWTVALGKVAPGRPFPQDGEDPFRTRRSCVRARPRLVGKKRCNQGPFPVPQRETCHSSSQRRSKHEPFPNGSPLASAEPGSHTALPNRRRSSAKAWRAAVRRASASSGPGRSCGRRISRIEAPWRGKPGKL